MDSVPNAATQPAAAPHGPKVVDPASVPCGRGVSSEASTMGVRFELSPQSESAPKQKRFARSSTPTMRSSRGESSRAQTVPPKRTREQAEQPMPERVDPGSPWSNVAADLPGNGASADDVRFWAYKRLGCHLECLNKLAVNSNFLLDQAEQVKKEMKKRPTHDEVKGYIQAEIMARMQDRPNFDQTKTFVVEAIAQGHVATRAFVLETVGQSHAAAETKTNVLTAELQAIVIQIDEALKDGKQNVKWIQTVENNFHQHVGEAFAKLERAVIELRAATTTTTTTAADRQDNRHVSPGPLGPRGEGGHRPGDPTGKLPAAPPGIAGFPIGGGCGHEAPEVNGSSDCSIRGGHCRHVEKSS